MCAQFCPTLWDSLDCSPPDSCPWSFPGENTGVGCHFLLLEIFAIQGSNPHLPGLLNWPGRFFTTESLGKPFIHKTVILYIHKQALTPRPLNLLVPQILIWLIPSLYSGLCSNITSSENLALITSSKWYSLSCLILLTTSVCFLNAIQDLELPSLLSW